MARRKHPTILEASIVNVVKRRGYPRTNKDIAAFIREVMRESRVLIQDMEIKLMNDAVLGIMR